MLKRLIFLAIFALPFFVVLDDSSVWDANEAFYVQTPREMLERGDWIIPYFNGEPRLNKPPLSYWLVGSFYQLFGVSLFWERLLLAVLGFGSVLLVYRAGGILFDTKTALVAAGIFATTFRLLMLSRRLLIDILLLFCLLAVLVFFLRWLKDNRPGNLVWAAVFLGLAFLTKGPVAFLGPGLLAVFLVVTGEWRRLKTKQLVLPGVVFAVIASSWFVLLVAKLGWDPVMAFFLKENLGRFSNVDYGPARGIFYYAGVFLGDFFPWSLFFVAALIGAGFRNRVSVTASDSVLLLIWVAGYLVFFSLSHNKQEYYILPAYPAAALWLAGRLRLFPTSRWLAWPLAALLPALIVGLYLYASLIFPPGLLWLSLLAAPLVAVSLFFRRLDFAAAALSVFYALAFISYLPPFEAYKPVPAFVQKIQPEIERLTGEGKKVEAGYLNYTAPSLVFYLNRPVFESYSLSDAAARMKSGTIVFMIVRAEDYNALSAASGRALQIVDSRPKIYTTARFFIEGLKRDGYQIDRSTRAVYLVTNKGPGHTPVISHHPGF